MRQLETTSRRPKILPTPGQRVKAKIIGSGLSLRALARGAGIAPSTLSNYLVGRRRDRNTQHDIWFAFRALTGQDLSIADFWGSLLSTEIAA